MPAYTETDVGTAIIQNDLSTVQRIMADRRPGGYLQVDVNRIPVSTIVGGPTITALALVLSPQCGAHEELLDALLVYNDVGEPLLDVNLSCFNQEGLYTLARNRGATPLQLLFNFYEDKNKIARILNRLLDYRFPNGDIVLNVLVHENEEIYQGKTLLEHLREKDCTQAAEILLESRNGNGDYYLKLSQILSNDLLIELIANAVSLQSVDRFTQKILEAIVNRIDSARFEQIYNMGKSILSHLNQNKIWNNELYTLLVDLNQQLSARFRNLHLNQEVHAGWEQLRNTPISATGVNMLERDRTQQQLRDRVQNEQQPVALADDPQNVHRREIMVSTSLSLKKLIKRYNHTFTEAQERDILEEIKEYIASYSGEELAEKKQTAAQCLQDIIAKRELFIAYLDEPMTLPRILCLIWQGTQDINALPDEQPFFSKDAKNNFIRLRQQALIEKLHDSWTTYPDRDYSRDCPAGAVIKLVAALDKAHPDVNILYGNVLNEAGVFVQNVLAGLLKKENKKLLWQIYKDQITSNPDFDEFLAKAKKSIMDGLHATFGTLITEDECKDFIADDEGLHFGGLPLDPLIHKPWFNLIKQIHEQMKNIDISIKENLGDQKTNQFLKQILFVLNEGMKDLEDQEKDFDETFNEGIEQFKKFEYIQSICLSPDNGQTKTPLEIKIAERAVEYMENTEGFLNLNDCYRDFKETMNAFLTKTIHEQLSPVNQGIPQDKKILADKAESRYTSALLATFDDFLHKKIDLHKLQGNVEHYSTQYCKEISKLEGTLSVFVRRTVTALRKLLYGLLWLKSCLTSKPLNYNYKLFFLDQKDVQATEAINLSVKNLHNP